MSSSLHSAQTVADGNHIATSLEYADSTARLAASLTASDIGRHARQLDNNTFWVLKNHSPLTWAGVDLSTQIYETDGPTILDIEGITDGEYLRRVGTEIVSADPGSTSTGGVLGVVRKESDSSAKIAYGIGGTALTTALAAASSGDVILLGPGPYVGNFVIPAGVTVLGTDTQWSVVFTPADLNDHLFTLNTGCILRNVSVNLPTGSNKAAVYTGLAALAIIRDITFQGAVGASSGIGILVDGTHACQLRVFTSQYTSGTCDTIFKVDNTNALIACGFLTVFGGTANYAIHVNAGQLSCSNINISSSTITKAFYLTNTCLVIADVCTIYGTTYGLHITSTSANFVSQAFGCDLNVTHNILIDAGLNPRVLISSGHLDRNKVSYPATATSVVLVYVDDREGDRGLLVEGELVVGRKGNGKEAVIGEGDSHVIGMKVFHNSNGEIGTWTDITDDAASPSGSPLNVWPDVTTGSAIYIGGDDIFPGVKVNVLTAAVFGAGAASIEYWNGSAWVGLNTMAALADYPYTQYGLTALDNTGNQQVRFAPVESLWQKKTLNGEEKYWFRSILTAGITSVAVVESFKLHTNRFEINRDGFTEYFGLSRQSRTLAGAHRNLLEPIVGSTPASEPILLSANISLNSVANEFSNNAVDAKGGIIPIPEGIDTSHNLVFRIVWLPKATTGDVELELTYGIGSFGDIIDGTLTDTTITDVQTVSGTINQATVSVFNIPITDAVPGDGLGIKLLRDATAGNADDTMAASVVLVTTNAFGTFWRG